MLVWKGWSAVVAGKDSRGAEREFSGDRKVHVVFWEVTMGMRITGIGHTEDQNPVSFTVLNNTSTKTLTEQANESIMTVTDLDT